MMNQPIKMMELEPTASIPPQMARTPRSQKRCRESDHQAEDKSKRAKQPKKPSGPEDGSALEQRDRCLGIFNVSEKKRDAKQAMVLSEKLKKGLEGLN